MQAGETSPIGLIVPGRVISRRVFRLYLLSMAVVSAAGFPLLLLALDVRELGLMFRLLAAAAMAMAVVVAVDTAAMRRQLAPVRRWLDGLDGSESAARTALVRLVELPYLSARRVLLLHTPVAFISFFVASALVGLPVWPPAREMVTAALLMLASGVWEALFEFFALNRQVPRWLEPFQSEPAYEGALRTARAVRARGKLLLASLGLVFVPIILLAGTLLLRVWPALRNSSGVLPLLLYVAVLIGVIALGGWAVARLLAEEATAPLSHLLQAMQRARGGNFHRQLPVARADEFGRVFQGFNDMVRGLRERDRLRDAFGRYVAPELVDRVLSRGVELGGELIDGTVLFADIRGFTTLSEQLRPDEVVSLLNAYFAAVEPAVHAEGGWINKFGGDSLLAVFGAPVHHEDHAARAVRAAIALRKALAAFNRAQREKGRHELAIGVGIHSGEMIAGNVGSPSRLEYTVIGDVVNAAARLQILTREHGVDVLLSSTSWERAGRCAAVTRVGEVRLRGRSEPLVVLALDDPETGSEAGERSATG